jgi:hypothetical protein
VGWDGAEKYLFIKSKVKGQNELKLLGFAF